MAKKIHRVLANIPINIYPTLKEIAEREFLSTSAVMVKALIFYIQLSASYGKRMPPEPVEAMVHDPKVVNDMHERWFPVRKSLTFMASEFQQNAPQTPPAEAPRTIKRFRPTIEGNKS